MKKNKGNIIYILFILLILGARITNVLTVNVISGSSMIPTYHEKEIVVGSVIPVKAGLKHGDIVTAISNGGTPVIKRVIGMPGDEITVDAGGWLYLNGALLDEEYVNETPILSPNKENQITYKLDDDEYFICGDNRNYSNDSRSYGPIKESQVVSKVLFRLFPKLTFRK